MPLTPDERRELRLRSATPVPGFDTPTAAEEFRAMGDWCEAQGVRHDLYGDGELMANFEAKLATLLGLPAAVFMPSGVMAQLAAVRIWTEQAGLPRFGIHPTSHLALHEEQAYEALWGLHGVPVGDRLRPLLAKDLEACKQPLACLLMELPIRESGGQLPSWDELAALKAAARERSLPLHMDGARLWESAPFYGRPHAEIVEGFDSVYVSLYKGVGGLSGAMLAGSASFVAQARLWRRRMGGTLYHLSPMVISAAMRFDERLAQMPRLYERACQLAAALKDCPGLRVNAQPPQTNLLHLHFDRPLEALLDARDAIATETGCWLIDWARATEVPGWSMTELNVGDRLLALDDAQLLPLFRRLAGTA